MLINDIKFSVRQLVKQPLFSLIAILMLALGIGANTAVFGLMNSVTMRSLPVRNPHELRGINWVGEFTPQIHGRISSTPDGEQISNTFTYPIYREFQDRSAGVAEVFSFQGFSQFWPPTTLIRGQAYTLDGMMVSGNFFEGLGVEPALGQVLSSEYDRQDVAPTAVLSYHAWQRYYGLDPNVIGQTIVVNQVNATVIGVLPKEFLGIEKGHRFDVYVPLSLQPRIEGISPETSPDSWCVQVMARLEPDVDECQVSRSLGTLFTRTLEEMGVDTSEKNLRIVLTDGSGGLSGVLAPRLHQMAQPLYLLFWIGGDRAAGDLCQSGGVAVNPRNDASSRIRCTCGTRCGTWTTGKTIVDGEQCVVTSWRSGGAAIGRLGQTCSGPHPLVPRHSPQSTERYACIWICAGRARDNHGSVWSAAGLAFSA